MKTPFSRKTFSALAMSWCVVSCVLLSCGQDQVSNGEPWSVGDEQDACMPVFGLSCEQIRDGYLKASNSEPQDGFGWSVSLSGDRLAVGAPGEASCADGVEPASGQTDNGCDGAGAVYVFARDAQTQDWRQEAYLKASNPETDDGFGGPVSLSGDRLAVGAHGEASCADGVEPASGQTDNGCEEAGAVYVFGRDGQTGAWSQTAYLKASNSEAQDRFGWSVSLSGDRLAVGASREASCADGVDLASGQADNGCVGAGAVYVFEREVQTGAWSQTAYLKASNSEPQDRFGWSVSLSGDQLAVGADGEWSCADGVEPASGQTDNGCLGAGAVYVFEHEVQTGVWSQTTYLKASNSEPQDRFGGSVSLSGARLAVGASGEASCADGVDLASGQADNGCVGAGAVYVFEREVQTGIWSQTAYLKASNSELGDQLGRSVSLSGDRLAVGATWEDSCADGVDLASGQADNGCVGAGAVYVFEREVQTGIWSQIAYLKASNSEPQDRFGGSVSISGDRLAVGAWWEASCADGVEPASGQTDNGCEEAAGAVYSYRLAP